MNWLACSVANGKEYFVRGKIREIAPKAEIIVPRRYTKDLKAGKVKTKSEKILPGYILVGTEMPLDVAKIKNFVKVIGPLTEQQIVDLKVMEGSKEEVLDVGTKILVIEGAFQGCKGSILENKAGGDMKCRILFTGMPIEVVMKPDMIASLDSKGE